MDAIPHPVVRILDSPMPAVHPQEILRRCRPGIERGGDMVCPVIASLRLQFLPVADDAGDPVGGRSVDGTIKRRHDMDGALLQPSMRLAPILDELPGGVPLPVDAAEGGKAPPGIIAGGEDAIGAAAGDQLRGPARGVQLLAVIARPAMSQRPGRSSAAIIVEVRQGEGGTAVMTGEGRGLVMALAIAVGPPYPLAIGGHPDPGPRPASDHRLERIGAGQPDHPVDGGSGRGS